jgi:hypothetical protein
LKAALTAVASAFGPRSLELGGRCFDEVVLHTFFTDVTTGRCVETVTSIPGAIDGVASTEQLERIGALIPDEWLAPIIAAYRD